MKKILFLPLMALVVSGCASNKDKHDPAKYDAAAEEDRFFYHGWWNPKENDRDAGFGDRD